MIEAPLIPTPSRLGLKNLPSVCLVLPYFGDLPVESQYFFLGVEHNPTIDVLFISDAPRPSILPINVHWCNCSMDELRRYIDNRLNIATKIMRPYKLCDLRPAYGHIFEGALSQFDFWCWGDLDVLWGDLRSFWTNEWLESVDVASFRGELFVSGALTLIRNTNYLNTFYQIIPGYEDVFANEDYYGFDECMKRWSPDERTVQELIEAGEAISFTDAVRE